MRGWSEYLSLGAICAGLFAYREISLSTSPILDGVLAGACGMILHAFVNDARHLVRRRGLYFVKALGRVRPNKQARVSMAVLIRLVVGGDVLLVWNRKAGVPAAFGGVLKYFDSAHNTVSGELSASPSTFASRGDENDDHKYKNDLRLTMPLSRLGKFLGWYDSGAGRESYPLREFWEELLEAGLDMRDIDPIDIGFSRYQTVRTIRWEDENQWYSYLSWEVWEAHVDPSVSAMIATCVSENRTYVECGDNRAELVLASKKELEAMRVKDGRLKGQVLGDNVWALDKGISVPRGWWRDEALW